jgi:aldehyde dehydrogenase (NAD+)
MLDRRNFYINGGWVPPAAASDHDVINPSTGEPCAVISFGDQADTDAAVAAAGGAFSTWGATPAGERIELLEALFSIYKDRSEEMAEAISLEMGAPVSLAKIAQVGAGAGHIKAFIRVLKEFDFQHPLSSHVPGTEIIYEPAGVAALITPWNWPMNQVTLKVTPALGAGCTVVLKPSEIAPLSSMLLTEMIDAAGFPAGVFNLVNGDGAGVGTQLTGHPRVDMVSFTGSTRAGVAITKNAANTVKRVALELGGKGANIIFVDADDKAVTRGVRGCFINSGQSCNAPTRMLVERSAYEQAVETAVNVAGQTAVDLSSSEGRHIGPVASKIQFDKIQRLIKTGIDEGARLVAGGPGRPEGHEHGYFVRPTVFADVTPTMSIAREEIFGPVLSIMAFDTEDEAIEIANDTAYGLTNYVQTQDLERARRVARKLRSGMVEMNGQFLGSGSPFGGYGHSGNGREGGPWGLEEFLEVKAVSGWRPVEA